jgi:hypothetical protein
MLSQLNEWWQVNRVGEALMLFLALSLWLFGLWPVRLPLRWLRRRRQEKRLVRLMRRGHQGNF